MEEFEVELWSTDPRAVEATRNTLRILKPGDNNLIERDGRFFITSTHANFVKFAVAHQGYVKRVL